jgi:hypothetical protein
VSASPPRQSETGDVSTLHTGVAGGVWLTVDMDRHLVVEAVQLTVRPKEFHANARESGFLRISHDSGSRQGLQRSTQFVVIQIDVLRPGLSGEAARVGCGTGGDLGGD